jgi:hypothetical protein
MSYDAFNIDLNPSKLIDGLMQPPHDYKSDKYSYTVNKDGFRSVDFLTKPPIITLGCSITFGTGLPEGFNWPSQLQSLLGKDKMVGNLGDHGSSIMKNISQFFSFIKKYNYLPEYLLCNFPDFQRFYFINKNLNNMENLFWLKENIKTKGTAPFEWDKIVPSQWINWSNLDHIKMLEQFCYFNNIKLIWTTWSDNIPDELEDCLAKDFMFYKKDPTRELFPNDFEFNFAVDKIDNLRTHYAIIDSKIDCHSQVRDNNQDVFDFGYDHGNINPPFHPHPGSHRHAHWADFFYKEMENIKNDS